MEEKRKQLEALNNNNIANNQRTLNGYQNELVACCASLSKNANAYENNLVVYENVKSIAIPTAEELYSALISQFNEIWIKICNLE